MRRIIGAILVSLIAGGPAVFASGPKIVRIDGAVEATAVRRPIHIHAGSFDPLLERVDTAGIEPLERTDGRYALVQFHPGPFEQWKEELESAGVEFVGYIPDGAWQIRVPTGTFRIASHAGVRWVEPYQSGWKVHRSLWPGSDELRHEVIVVPFRGENLERIARAIEKTGRAWNVTPIDDGAVPRLLVTVWPEQRDQFVLDTAGITGVAWLEPALELRLENERASSVIQGNGTSPAQRAFFNRGLTGTGQIVAVADSGADVDMCFFRFLNGVEAVTSADLTDQPELGSIFADRKVIGYWVQRGADPYDNNETCPGGSPTGFHGTHTASSAVGDNLASPSTPSSPGIDPGDGMAPNAQLLFQDVGSSDGCLSGTGDLFNTFLQALRAGAKTHTDSFGGNSSGDYTMTDRIVDTFLFEHEGMTIFTSAGNDGPGSGTSGSPGNSKNIVSVGALTSGADPTSSASFSGRGPTSDGRIKPDLLAPGSGIVSAAGNATFGDGNCGTRTLSGTSMASPIAAGGSALVRQYLEQGYYPTGSPRSDDSLDATSTLIKAILLNGTRPLPDGGEFGNFRHGWGRVFLDGNVFFPGDSREMRVWDLPNLSGMSTGVTHEYAVNVGSGEEFRATLVWSDPPASFGSAVALVNDLDLEVTNGSETFRGNVFSSAGQSVPGGESDRRNNVEQVRFTAPSAGSWTVRVRAHAVPGNSTLLSDRQGYALVVSHQTCDTAVTFAPTRLSATSNPVQGIDLRFEPAEGSSVTQIYRATLDDPNDWKYVGSSPSGLFTDARAQGGETYFYRARGVDGCGEGPPSATALGTSTSGCDIQPTFDGLQSAAPASPHCAVFLQWAPASKGCALGETVFYNIYRSTDPDFVPAPGEAPIASVRNETTFIDTEVESGLRYHYIVRAEDTASTGTGPHEGREEKNVRRLSAISTGPATALGDWIDDAGDTSSLVDLQFPWHVSTRQAHSGTSSYFAGRENGNYPALICAALTTPALTLGNNSTITYWARYNLEFQWDGVIVEISTDGGNSWSDLPPSSGYPSSLSETLNPPVNQCGYPATQGAFNGPVTNDGLTEWTEFSSDLAAYAGETVRIRWRLTTDPGLEFEGFYLDDITVTEVGIPGPCIPLVLSPGADFSWSPRSPLSGLPVEFTDESIRQPTSWSWEFGDGATSSERNPSHTYLEPGDYQVTLTAANNADSDSITRIVPIYDNNLSYEIRGVIPGQARTRGAQNSFFKTSFWMTNLSTQPTSVRLRYLATPVQADGGAEGSIIRRVEPGESIAFSDVLEEGFGATTNTGGSIVIEVPSNLPAPIVTTRTYNQPGQFSGTSGQYIPAVLLEEGDGTSARIDGLTDNGSFRSNIGVLNLEDIAMNATLRVVNQEGVVLGSPVPITVQPYSMFQVNRITNQAAAGSLDVFSVVVESDREMFVYASKLDNVTSDPTYISSTLPARSLQWIDGVGSLAGAGGTFFRSNLSLTNRNGSAANVTIIYRLRGTGQPSIEPASLTIPAATSIFFEDSVLELFARPGTAGTFEILSDVPLIAWGRTFNDRDLSGTLGQYIPGFGEEDLIPSSGSIIQGLSENSEFRTNVGIVNVSETPGHVVVQVWAKSGQMLGQKSYPVGAKEARFVGRLLTDVVPGSSPADAYLILIPSQPGAFYAWASYVDNRSTDQTFVRPIRIP